MAVACAPSAPSAACAACAACKSSPGGLLRGRGGGSGRGDSAFGTPSSASASASASLKLNNTSSRTFQGTCISTCGLSGGFSTARFLFVFLFLVVLACTGSFRGVVVVAAADSEPRNQGILSSSSSSASSASSADVEDVLHNDKQNDGSKERDGSADTDVHPSEKNAGASSREESTHDDIAESQLASSAAAQPRESSEDKRRRELLQATAPPAQAPAGDGGGTPATPTGTPAPADGDASADLQPMTVVYNRDDFTRAGPYPYKECIRQPGEIGNDPAKTHAQCIPIEAGELTFCGGVAYDACMRVGNPSDYDLAIEASYLKRVTYSNTEETQTAARMCAFKSFLCANAFPQCLEYAELFGQSAEFERYYEIPLCWGFCVSSEMACLADGNAAALACMKLVEIGRVAPDRPGIICQGAGHAMHAAVAVVWAVLVVMATSPG
ncbi:hypothetical protein PPROV_000910500 [Pycnococcus provasolii]|uniref:FZ domain-containing protein n=1 Tax=Pycnococcus provasolii TaxID=41880 RepID=A0A830HT93_9CHLO|nr:hypothetical protein PPROV_000910500 [Pycnococcus provasolii]